MYMIIFFILNAAILVANGQKTICDTPKHVYSKISSLNKNRIDVDDVLDIKFGTLNTINEISFTASLDYDFIQNLQPAPTQSLGDYLKDKVKRFDFQLYYKDSNSEKQVRCRYDIVDTTVNRIFQFENLKYLTDYTIRVGYTLNSGKTYEGKAEYKFQTCFGTPDSPSDLTYTLSKDCTLSFSWKVPTVINAPNVCYYQVNVRENGNQIINQKAPSSALILTNAKVSTEYIMRIDAVNDVSCYSELYPFVQTCTIKSTGSKSYSITIKTPAKCGSDTPGTITTTKKPGSNAVKNIISKLLIIPSFIISFLLFI